MPTPKAVIFDIGNVLIEWQPERFYDAEIGRDARIAMFGEIDLHGMNDRVDRGEVFRDVIYETAELYPNWRNEIRMWHDRWLELAQPVVQGSVDLLYELKNNGTPVFALTNFGVESFDLACEHYSFLNEFDRQDVSGRMKTIKPDVEIYEMLERDCGIDPAALIFADDRIDNIDAAKARGWQTHLFTTSKGWRDALVNAGVLSK